VPILTISIFRAGGISSPFAAVALHVLLSITVSNTRTKAVPYG
jgi:hypothetical protein